jgi:outer membrane protein with beta-barrel domain
MRKLSWFLMNLFFCLPLAVFCQKATIGITAGMSLANMHAKFGGTRISSDSKAGITAGVFTDIALSGQFSFQPALNFVQKGYTTKMPEIDYKDKLTLNYLELPLNFLFKPEMQKIQFFAGAGPSIAYALSGKEKETDNGNTQTYTYKFGNNPDEDDLKAIDFGANFLTGIETKSGFLVAANYNLGLSNTAPGSSSGGTIKSRYFGFKIGYMFKGKR